MKRFLQKIHPHRQLSHKLHGGVMIVTMLIMMSIMLSFAVVGIATVLREGMDYTEDLNARSAEQGANACADTAIERLGLSSSYAGNETLTLGDGTICTIFPVLNSGGWTIQTESWVKNRVARIQVILDNRNPVDIVSWNKVEHF